MRIRRRDLKEKTRVLDKANEEDEDEMSHTCGNYVKVALFVTPM
jgi:hypothetical protein